MLLAASLVVPQSSAGQAHDKHQGRKRSFAHVEGNFPTHVFTNSTVVP